MEYDNVHSDTFKYLVRKILTLGLFKNSVITIHNTAFHKSQATSGLLEYNGHEIKFLAPLLILILIILRINILNPNSFAKNYIAIFSTFSPIIYWLTNFLRKLRICILS